PGARFMNVETARRLLELAAGGATVLVWKELPSDVPGWREHAGRKAELAELLEPLSPKAPGIQTVGKGKLAVGEDLEGLLAVAGIRREKLTDRGLKFIRRKSPAGASYFVANHSAEPVGDWVELACPGRSVLLMDPMTGRTGTAPMRSSNGASEVYLQMLPGETRVLRVFSQKVIGGPTWPITKPAGEPIAVEGNWRVEFVEGGPALPPPFTTAGLESWTGQGSPEAERFAGAARYTIELRLPETDADGWMLDLGEVRESARVWVNGKPAGVVVAHPFRVDLAGLAQAGSNELAIEVTNLSANRIRDLDRRGVDWKKFYEINLVDQMYQPLDASGWDLEPSGLLGPVRVAPYRVE
ncbi:MAG: glycosylhydrolase-like jelly roll fold domain-containing protein, partial [Thermoguttaceae bacterium]